MKFRIYLFIYLFFSPYNLIAGVTSIENNISQVIIDNNCFNKIFTMPTSTTVTDIKIDVNIDHTWRADLDITLTSPLGTIVDLTSDNGGSRNNLYVLFNDAAPTSITADNANHTVTVERSPELPLSAFDGEDPQGDWILQICDDASGDPGIYNYARLDINDTVTPLDSQLIVNYKMDECYWLNGAGGVIGDVKDSTFNQNDGTSENTAVIDTNIRQICASGSFSILGDKVTTDNTAVLGSLTNQLTISAWLYPTAFTQWSAALIRTSSDSWNDGFGLIHDSGDGTNITFFINSYNGAGTVSAALTMNTWNHIVAVYNGTQLQIYRNGVLINTKAYSIAISNGSQALGIGNDVSAPAYDDVWQGNIDEVKVWTRNLSATEISTIYTNELAGNNYDGIPRVCNTCDANITAGIWGLIGIPADFRTAVNKDVADVFDEFPAGSYNLPANIDGWVVIQRNYSGVDNSSSYATVPYTGVPLEFGQGYWLLSKVDQAWSENTLPSVDYNSTEVNCTAGACVEIDLTSVIKNFGAPDNDISDGSGPNRNNMLGFVGQVPVDWADCRILITDVNGTTVYTATGAEAAGYMDKQVWQYNPGVGGANANGYTTCDDSTPGGCKLEPYKGFWVVLYGKTKGKTVKLLIPKE